MTQDPWGEQVEALGRLIHSQRKLAKLSLRELASMSDISNAYLSSDANCKPHHCPNA